MIWLQSSSGTRIHSALGTVCPQKKAAPRTLFSFVARRGLRGRKGLIAPELGDMLCPTQQAGPHDDLLQTGTWWGWSTKGLPSQDSCIP